MTNNELEKIQIFNRKAICSAVKNCITAPLSGSRVILALNLSKINHDNLNLKLTKPTLEEESEEIQFIVAKMFGYKEVGSDE